MPLVVTVRHASQATTACLLLGDLHVVYHVNVRYQHQTTRELLPEFLSLITAFRNSETAPLMLNNKPFMGSLFVPIFVHMILFDFFCF